MGGMGEHRALPRAKKPQRSFKEPSSRWVSLAVWAGSAVAVGWLVLAGRPGAATAAAPWLAALALLVYLTQWLPRLVVEDGGFDVENGLRRHWIPFSSIEDLEVRRSVVIRAAGRKFVSWGAPTPQSAFAAGFEQARDWKQRPYGMLPGNERMGQSQPAPGRDAIVAVWQEARQADGNGAAAWRPADPAVVSTWNFPMVVLGLLVAGWCLVSVLV